MPIYGLSESAFEYQYLPDYHQDEPLYSVVECVTLFVYVQDLSHVLPHVHKQILKSRQCMYIRVSHFRKSFQMMMHIWDIVMHANIRPCANFHFFSQSFWSPAKRFNFTRRNTKENDSRRFFGLFDQKLISKKRIDFKNPFC